jgi:hypothetical protein
MSYGKDEHHVDKHVWKLPIPVYNPDSPVHRQLAELGRQEAELVAALVFDEGTNYVTLRQQVRKALAASNHAALVSGIVIELLS